MNALLNFVVASLHSAFILRGAMTAPAVFWPTVLGVSFLAAGFLTYKRDLLMPTSRSIFRLAALGPTIIASIAGSFRRRALYRSERPR